MIVSIDPGETTGFAEWSERGELLKNWEGNFDRVLSFLNWTTDVVTKFVVEDYQHRKQHQGSRFVAVQVIGAVKLRAYQIAAPVILQRPDILRITAMHAEIELPKGHIPDATSAYLHGYYYFENAGITVAEAQRRLVR